MKSDARLIPVLLAPLDAKTISVACGVRTATAYYWRDGKVIPPVKRIAGLAALTKKTEAEIAEMLIADRKTRKGV